MADTATNPLTPDQVAKLVEQFQKIADPAEKSRFYWDNPPLHAIFSSIHFPKTVVPIS